jgi:predicted dehydrogenase
MTASVVSGEIEPAGLSALDTNVTVIRILDAARESAKTGRTIRLADR